MYSKELFNYLSFTPLHKSVLFSIRDAMRFVRSPLAAFPCVIFYWGQTEKSAQLSCTSDDCALRGSGEFIIYSCILQSICRLLFKSIIGFFQRHGMNWSAGNCNASGQQEEKNNQWNFQWLQMEIWILQVNKIVIHIL